MKFFPIALLVAASASAGCAAQYIAPVGISENAELTRLYGEDQADREGSVDWTRVTARDSSRRERANAMLQTGALHTGKDYLHAAMIFQHGTLFSDVRLAQSLATLAMTIDPRNEQAHWLAAAALDRMLVYKHQAQLYGTQYSADDKGVYLYPVAASAVSDDERREMHVPTLAEAQHKVSEMAAENKLTVRASAPTLEELQAKESH